MAELYAPAAAEPGLERLWWALPDLGMALYAMAVWIAPLSFSPGTLNAFGLLFVTEFFVTHGSAFMGHYALFKSGAERAGGLLLLTAIYMGMVGLVSARYGSWWPLAWFWALILNRLLPLLLSGEAAEVKSNILGLMIARNVLAILAAVAAGSLLPLPRLGLTRPVIAPDGLPYDDGHRLLAICALYFSIQGYITLRPLLNRRGGAV